MGKKYFNWIGWSLVVLYVAIYIGLYLAAYYSGDVGIRKLISIGIFPMIILILFTLRKTWKHVLPEKVSRAKVFDKKYQESTSWAEQGEVSSSTLTLVFELEDGSLKSFNMNLQRKLYNQISKGDKGILKYNEYKNKLYLISFDKQP